MTATGAIQDLAVLAILDRDSDVKGLREIISGWGARLHVRRTLAGLRRQLDRQPPDVVVSNASLRDHSDWKHVLHEIESAGGLQPLIITSRVADESLWAEVLNLGGFDVLAQPFDRDEVARILCSAVRDRRASPAPRRGQQKEERPPLTLRVAG
jgi:DNA-binding NtrC family response regulator